MIPGSNPRVCVNSQHTLPYVHYTEKNHEIFNIKFFIIDSKYRVEKNIENNNKLDVDVDVDVNL